MIEIKNLSKTFTGADNKVEALKNVSLTISDGDIYGIIGMSGAGKSTLVRCINMLERPTEGSVLIDGRDIGAMRPDELRAERRKISMIFQSFNLLMQKNCLKNVCFPMQMSGIKKSAAVKKAGELLEMVGLADKAYAYPAQLSGGQKQRVAIARALATDPKILLCDEATSALDPQTTHSILSLIQDINRQLGITIVMITHQINVVEEICSHVAILDGGEVAEAGTVSEIFSSPKSNAARSLVLPEGYDEYIKESGEHILRIVFNGPSAAGTPLIAKMAMDLKIAANILFASTKSIKGKTYGSMLLGIPGSDNDLKRALDYVRSFNDVTVEEEIRNAR